MGALLLLLLLQPYASSVDYKLVRVKAVRISNSELLEWGIKAISVDNLTVVYSFPYDFLYMGIYTGGESVTLKPLIGPCVCGISEFLVYNGSLFFVSNDGATPHTACDEVVELNPHNLSMRNWVLSWDARERINPERAGNIPYAQVDIGLDESGELWAKVYLLFENETLYYFYSGGNFTLVNETPSSLSLPKPRKVDVVVQNGSFYLKIPMETERVPESRGVSWNVVLYGVVGALVIVLLLGIKRR